ncbi:hypothetical protein J2W91_004709 [Paenibacillus amylolyticus]|uniref:Uncharacterized protein n=1 Tax=Paenibacillus amylolyticus TaxID=1451 RepID=A0AAP5H4I3_PAEAM|nr:hypothetical protein [Paenibacillus amylolyticus]MDR6726203.1 hypothetical protein [Paenibacillus amylolyticus]
MYRKWIVLIILILIVGAGTIGYIVTKNSPTLETEGAQSPSRETYESMDYNAIGDLPETLSYQRLLAAADEWYVAPHGPINPDDAGKVASNEFPETQPQSLTELLVEMAAMYRGETPFTKARIVSFEYFSSIEPISIEIEEYGPLPIPDISDADNHDIRVVEIENAYKNFKAYVDKVKVTTP